MWFKTRVSLFSIDEPWQIKVAFYRSSEPPHAGVYVQPTINPELQYKGILGKLKATNITHWIARFALSDTSERAIAECFELIEAAIRTDAKVCDLSAVGDPAAWPNWHLIAWRHTVEQGNPADTL